MTTRIPEDYCHKCHNSGKDGNDRKCTNCNGRKSRPKSAVRVNSRSKR